MSKKIDYEILDLINIVNNNYSKMSEMYDDKILTNENSGEYSSELIKKLLESAFICGRNFDGRRNGKTYRINNLNFNTLKLKEYVASLELNLLAYKEVCDILEILIKQRLNH